jgi:hypothetical protein
VARWHLPPGARLRLVTGGAEVTMPAGRFTVSVTASTAAGPQLAACLAEISAGFARTVVAPVLACTLNSELPVRISTVWRQTHPQREAM